MEIKNIDATLNRPEGERLIDAPFVFVDIDKFSKQLKNEDAWEKNNVNSITVYKTEGMTVVVTCLHKNALLEKTTVDGWLTVQVIDGAVDFSVKEKTLTLEKNQLMTLHPGVEYGIEARKETTLLITNRTAG